MNQLLHCSLVALLLSAPSLAQTPGLRQDTRALRQDHRELQQDRRELRDDQRDAAHAATLMARYDAARRRQDNVALAALDSEALRQMAAELAEGRAELRRDAAEVAREGHEVHQSRRERGTESGPLVRADDRRDRRDDVRDARAKQEDGRHVGAIRSEYTALSGRMDAVSLDRKSALLADFLRRSRHELPTDAAERHEDRQERREDWRERREDLR
jgi:hypothetical protein